MGLFNNKVAESTNEALEYLLNEDATRNQSLALLLGLATILVFRLFNTTRSKLLNGGHARECVLKISELNNTTLVKEVFLAYLNAALLEPVLTIGGMEDLNKEEFFLNLFELLSLCWWIWLLTDAFDFFDVMQFYKFHVEFKEEAEKNPKYSFLRFTKRKVVDELERQSLVGSLKKDVALWFMLACIGAAWAPDISINHRDALHAYVVVFMWAIMHHRSQKAVSIVHASYMLGRDRS
jgi:hypothetical protein